MYQILCLVPFQWNDLKEKLKILVWYTYIWILFAKNASYLAYQNSTKIKGFALPFFKWKYFKPKYKFVLVAHNVFMVTYCVAKMITAF